MQRTGISWVVPLIGIGLAGVVAVSAAASTVAASSTASPLEIIFHARHEPCPDGATLCTVRNVGTFTSGAPFCESGAAVDDGWAKRRANSETSVLRVFECADGSGSLGLWIASMPAEHRGAGSEWRIDYAIPPDVSGRYAGLRGKGTSSEQRLGGNPDDPATITLKGFAGAEDATAPSLAFTSASPTKLRRRAGAYSIRVTFSLRDDVEGPPVAYKLGVTEGRTVLASTTGTTASGSVSTTLRVLPSSKRVRSVDLRVYGSDWIGNEVSIARSLKLPR
jgi:hypothetical protein